MSVVMKILVVEDDPKLASFLTRVLREENHESVAVGSIRDAMLVVGESASDLLIIDRMLPDGDGLELLAWLRSSGMVKPVIVLTALGELAERIAGLDAGADDYILKPFEIDELLARIRVQMRRDSTPVRTLGALRIDMRSRRLWKDDSRVDLTGREFDVLAHLLDADGNILSRTRLLASVWGTERDPGTNLVEVHVSRLRGKLGDAAWMIETVRGGGYRFRREPNR